MQLRDTNGLQNSKFRKIPKEETEREREKDGKFKHFELDTNYER